MTTQTMNCLCKLTRTAANSLTLPLVLVAASLLLGSEIWAVEVEGWGTVVDPSSDCKVQVGDGAITITVPDTKHDLYYGGKNVATRFNAPRVVQWVEGNFTATVRVTADWDTGVAELGYNGAGLVVWDSELQYLRHERNRFTNRSNRTLSYTTPQYDQNNRRVFFNSTTEPFFQGESTWMRVIRFGPNFTTQISHDGENWITTGIVSGEFPAEVRVGILAINSASHPFEVRFDQFSVTQK